MLLTLENSRSRDRFDFGIGFSTKKTRQEYARELNLKDAAGRRACGLD